ncbi:MAG: hypothetical protein JNL69_03755, partial [Bacteroidia bacterium]|nr:hypothetical protein [Bacteroidia bacterium]
MKSVVEKIAYSDNNPIAGMIELIDFIRPSNPNNASSAINQLIILTEILREDEKLKNNFSAKLVDVIGKSEQTELFTQVNIISFKGLWPELRKRLFNKLLPYVADENTLRGIINLVFKKKTDYIWLEQIPEKIIIDFFQVLNIVPPAYLPKDHYIIDELCNDIYILSQVIVALSIDKSIVKNFKEVLQMDSPFMKLHDMIDEYVAGVEINKIELNSTHETYLNIIEQIECSKEMVHKIRESKSVYGTSLELTSVLQKLLSSLKRMNDLLDLLVLEDKEKFNILLYKFVQGVIKLENRKYSIRSLFNDNISLLAYQMTEHTGKIGEHYVTNNAKEYFEMFVHALKGGLIVGFLVISKFLINGLHLPLFHDTMLKALNYSLGFIGIQLFHGTLATKQPSMTAST